MAYHDLLDTIKAKGQRLARSLSKSRSKSVSERPNGSRAAVSRGQIAGAVDRCDALKDDGSPATTTDHPHDLPPSETINATGSSKGDKITGTTEADLLFEITAIFRQLPVHPSDYTQLHEIETKLEEKHNQLSTYVDMLQLAGVTTRREDLQSVLRELSKTHQLVHRMCDSAQREVVSKTLGHFRRLSCRYRHLQPKPCAPNTRVSILSEIMEWVDDDQGSKVYLLTGAAGTGKSAICKTIANSLDDKNNLGGWIFFKKGDPDCRSCVDLFSSRRWLHDLASHLCSRFQWHKHLSQSLIRDPDMAQRDIGHQVRTLIAEPFEQERSRAAAAGEQMTHTFLVIDALDECADKDVEVMVKLLADIPGIRCLIATRSMLYPKALKLDRSPEVCDLDSQDQEVVRAEIKSYLTYEIDRFREKYNARSEWPGENIIDRLTDGASPLFVVAAKMIELLDDEDWDISPKSKFQNFLENQTHRAELALSLGKDTLPGSGQLDSQSSPGDRSAPI